MKDRKASARWTAILLVLLWIPMIRADTPQISVSVKDSGAKGDGKTDDTKAFAQALDACGLRGGGIVEVPAGVYRILGNLTVPPNVTLRGTFTCAPTGGAAVIDKGQLGSTLLACAGRGDPHAPPFVLLSGDNAALEGLAIFYPDWDAKTVPPIPYPPTVATPGTRSVDNVAIQNCLFLNSYDAIRLVGAARHLIRNVNGYPSHCGIYLDGIGDIGRIENVHFWPFGYTYRTSDPYCQWINRNAVAFEMGFTDWQMLSGCFSFGYGVGYKFIASPVNGSTSCGKMIDCGADSCGLPIEFDAAYSHWEITNGEFVGRWGSVETTAVEIGPGVTARIGFCNCAFWGPISRVIAMRAPKGIVSLDSCQIESWNDASGAVDIEAGRAILVGNNFARPGKRQLIVAKGAGPVVATANLADPSFDVQAAPGTRVILSSNQTEP